MSCINLYPVNYVSWKKNCQLFYNIDDYTDKKKSFFKAEIFPIAGDPIGPIESTVNYEWFAILNIEKQ